MKKKGIFAANLSIILHSTLLVIASFVYLNNASSDPCNNNIIQIEFTTNLLQKEVKLKDNIKEKPKKTPKKQKTIPKPKKTIPKPKKTPKKQKIKPNDLLKTTSSAKVKNTVSKKVKELKTKNIKSDLKETKKEDEKKDDLKEKTDKKQGKTKEKEVKNKTVDKRALYSNTQTNTNKNSGAVLEMKGWEWDDKPEPNDETDEVGKIVFEIKIDNMGEIISIKTIERTVSIEVVRIYKESLENISFSKTKEYQESPNLKTSTGKVTFFIRYK